MLKKIIEGGANYIKYGWKQIMRLLQYPFKKWSFAEWHLSSTIVSTIRITPKYIRMGRNTFVWKNARIQAFPTYRGTSYNPMIILHDGVTIQQNVHITCAERIEIGENTAIVANVTITDIIHPYTAKDEHMNDQKLVVKPVSIGPYCSIFNNAVILAGVTIGKHVVIGANSVVTHDLPDYCVAVGNPARIIKRYNPTTDKWEKVNESAN